MFPVKKPTPQSSGSMGGSIHSTTMQQHQMQACKDCTPAENTAMAAANKHPVHTHPAHGIYSTK